MEARLPAEMEQKLMISNRYVVNRFDAVASFILKMLFILFLMMPFLGLSAGAMIHFFRLASGW